MVSHRTKLAIKKLLYIQNIEYPLHNVKSHLGPVGHFGMTNFKDVGNPYSTCIFLVSIFRFTPNHIPLKYKG
jgi:hypothetical protein